MLLWLTVLSNFHTSHNRMPSPTVNHKRCNSMQPSPSWEAELVTFPTFYRTPRFFTVFKTACHLSLSWTRLIHTTSSHPVSVKMHINILQFTARSSMSSLYFRVPRELSVCMSLLNCTCHMPHSPQSPLSDNPQIVRWEFEGQGTDGKMIGGRGQRWALVNKIINLRGL